MANKNNLNSDLDVSDIKENIQQNIKQLLNLQDSKGGISKSETVSKDTLKNFRTQMRSFPATPYTQYLHTRESESLMEDKKPEEAANRLIFSHAMSFQHKVLLQHSKRMSKQDHVKGKNKANGKDDDSVKDSSQDMIFQMSFSGLEAKNAFELVRGLPPEWTIVQISCLHHLRSTRFKETKRDVPSSVNNPDLCIMRLSSRGKSIQVRQVKSPPVCGVIPYLQELSNILTDHRHMMRQKWNDNYSKYVDLRKEHSERLMKLVESVEDSWLTGSKTLLFGSLNQSCLLKGVLDKIKSRLGNRTICESTEEQLITLLSGMHALNKKEIVREVETVLSMCNKEEIDDVCTILSNVPHETLDCLRNETRNPVILILDPAIISFPWESIPSLQAIKQTVSRVPSVMYLRCLWQYHMKNKNSVVQTGVSTDNIYYIVNPDQSLPKTQERLDKAFQKYSMNGLLGSSPDPGQIANILCNKDAFMYCGHGSGSAYIPNDKVEKLDVRAVPLLMGCSSGHLEKCGRLVDPIGTAQSYLIAFSPAILGFLWPVSDADVDNFTILLLEEWLSRKNPDLFSLAAKMRSSFKQFTNSAALVAYGLPIMASS